jgi:hypothetical protein
MLIKLYLICESSTELYPIQTANRAHLLHNSSHGIHCSRYLSTLLSNEVTEMKTASLGLLEVIRVLDLFLRVTSLCTIPTVESTWPSRRNYFGFRHVTMATERRRPLPWSAAQQHPK